MRKLRGKPLRAAERYDVIASAVENSARHMDLTEALPQVECGKGVESERKLGRGKLLCLLQVGEASLFVTVGQGTQTGKLIEHGAGISRYANSHGCKGAGIYATMFDTTLFDSTMFLAGAHARRGGNQHEGCDLAGQIQGRAEREHTAERPSDEKARCRHCG